MTAARRKAIREKTLTGIEIFRKWAVIGATIGGLIYGVNIKDDATSNGGALGRIESKVDAIKENIVDIKENISDLKQADIRQDEKLENYKDKIDDKFKRVWEHQRTRN